MNRTNHRALAIIARLPWYRTALAIGLAANALLFAITAERGLLGVLLP